MSAHPVHYYIYYRVAAPHVAAAERALRAALAEVERRCGVAGRVLHRIDEPLLWMEVYDSVHDPAQFEDALDAAFAAQRFATLLVPGSKRAMERFAAGSGLPPPA